MVSIIIYNIVDDSVYEKEEKLINISAEKFI